MAFPTLQTADTKSGTVTSNSSSWTITWPTNLAAGDLVLFLVGRDGTGGTGSTDGGFTIIHEQGDGDGAACKVLVAAKVAAGTETGTFTYTVGASEQGGWRTFRITGWYGGSLPAGGANPSDSDGYSSRNRASATESPSANPTYGGVALNPANWDVEDTLWCAVMACDTSRTVSAFPSDFPDNQASDVSGGAGGATLGTAWENLAAASETPGNWTISASDEFVVATIAIRPAANVVRVPRYTSMPQLLAH